MSDLEKKKKSWRHRCTLCSRNSGRYWRYWHSRHWNTKGKLGLFSRMFSLPLMLYGKCSLSPFMISPWYVCMYVCILLGFLSSYIMFEVFKLSYLCSYVKQWVLFKISRQNFNGKSWTNKRSRKLATVSRSTNYNKVKKNTSVFVKENSKKLLWQVSHVVEKPNTRT
jgi:hypothetical protein